MRYKKQKYNLDPRALGIHVSPGPLFFGKRGLRFKKRNNVHELAKMFGTFRCIDVASFSSRIYIRGLHQ
jgi:hypothetical protein